MIRRLAVLLLLCSPALAQQPPAAAPPAMNPAMPMPHPAAAAAGPADAAFARAHDTMMRDMAVPPTGNADRDFVQGMLPHHQGAVDMARVELQYGKDPALRRLAAGIVATQTKEIRFMRDWLRRHPSPQ